MFDASVVVNGVEGKLYYSVSPLRGIKDWADFYYQAVDNFPVMKGHKQVEYREVNELGQVLNSRIEYEPVIVGQGIYSVVRNHVPGPGFLGIRRMLGYSPDEKHFAYFGEQSDGDYLCLDDKVIGPLGRLRTARFSRNSKHVGYLVQYGFRAETNEIVRIEFGL